MYNNERFTIISMIEHNQFMIIDLIDELIDKRLTVLNIYINPSVDKSKNNDYVWDQMIKAIKFALITNLNIMIFGDINNLSNQARTMFTKLGFNVTKVGPTRINGRRDWFNFCQHDDYSWIQDT